MKKLLSFTLAAALLLSLAACGKPAPPAVNPPLVLGEKYLSDLDYEQALLQFDQAITIEPKNARGYLGKADALLHLSRQAEAASALDTGTKATGGEARAALYEAKIEVEKSAVDGYIGLSSAYEKLGWREVALALLQRVCGELPEESRLREALSVLAVELGIEDNHNRQAFEAKLAVLDKEYDVAQDSFDSKRYAYDMAFESGMLSLEDYYRAMTVEYEKRIDTIIPMIDLLASEEAKQYDMSYLLAFMQEELAILRAAVEESNQIANQN